MKKILGLSIAVLLVLAGCASASPEDAFETAKDKAEDSAQTIDFVVASVLTTEEGDVAFDNMGTIHQEAGDDFIGIVEGKTEIEGNYEDVVVYAPEGKFVMELDGNQTEASLDEILSELGLIDFTEVDELIEDFDDVSTEGNIHTYTLETTDLDDVLEFSTHGHLRDLEFKEGKMTQTLTLDKDVLKENHIFIESIYSDEEGTEFPVTQNITLKYTEGSTIEFPEFN